MDGLHEMAGSGVPIEIGGKTYLLSTLKAKHWGEAARVLISKRKSPMQIAKENLQGLPEAAQQRLIELAYRDERDGELVPNYKIEQWFESVEGAVWNFWKQISQAHPEITIDQAESLLTQLNTQERNKLAASLKDNEALPQGNSSGQVQQIAETASNGHSLGDVLSAS